MNEEITITINQVEYRLKRIYHPELPLTYHVHFNDWHQHTVFCMRNENGGWRILPMTLPGYVREAESELRSIIEKNESA